MWQRFSPPLQQAVLNAQKLADEMGSVHVDSSHLFVSLLQQCDGESVIANLLQLSGVSIQEAELYARSTLEERPRRNIEPKLTAGAKRVLEFCADEARRQSVSTIEVEHLFIACIRQQKGPHVGEVLRPLGLDAATLRQHLYGLKGVERPYPEGSPLNLLNEGSKQALDRAEAAMRASYCGQISSAHLLLGLLGDAHSAAYYLLFEAGVDIDELKRRIREAIVNDGQIAAPQRKFSPAVKRALERAKWESQEHGYPTIGTQHLLQALLPRQASIAEIAAYGSAVDDPLERIWPELPTEAISKRYKAIQTLEKQVAGRPKIEPTERCKKAVESAYQLMLSSSGSRISPAHLLLGILGDQDALAVEILKKAGCNIEQLKLAAQEAMPHEMTASEPAREFSRDARRVMLEATKAAQDQGFKFIDSSHMLVGLFGLDDAQYKAPLSHFLSTVELANLRTELQRPSGEVQEVISKADSRARYWAGMGSDKWRNWLGGSSFVFSLGCSFIFARQAPLSTVSAVALLSQCVLLFVSAIGTLLAILTNRSPRTKDFWITVFGGCMIGMMVGFYLFKR